MLQYELYLFARNTRKPFQELTNTRAAFEIFKQGADGDSGMLEKPFAATLAGCALDRSAFRPIKHALDLGRQTGRDKLGTLCQRP